MKKLFTLTSVGFFIWLIIIAVQAADGTYTSVSGVTTIGTATLPAILPGTVVTNTPLTNGTFIVIEGDSLSATGNTWPSYIFGPNITLPGYNLVLTNFSTAGESLANVDSEYTNQVYSVRPSVTGSNAILFLWAGAVGLNASGVTSSNWISMWSNYVWRASVRDGFKVCAFTIMNNVNDAGGANGNWFQTNRFLVNNYIRQSSLPNWVVDASVLFPNNWDTAVSSDGTHLTTTAYTALAKEVSEVLRRNTVRGPIPTVVAAGTNTLTQDITTGAIIGSGNTGGLTINQTSYTTNTSTMAPNFLLGYGYIVTNAAFTVLAPINVDATKVETCAMVVTNSTATVVVITPAAGWKSQGTWNVTNMSSITVMHYGNVITNAVCLPLF